MLAPACPRTRELLTDPEIDKAQWIGFLDRNPIQHGKRVDGRKIYGYEEIRRLNVDVILVASPEKHRRDIHRTIAAHALDHTAIAELDGPL